MTGFIDKDGKILPYQITYKPNKHTYYRIKPHYIDVTTNKRYPKHLITTFLTSNFDKFYQAFKAQEVERDDEIKLWGKTYELRVHVGNFKYDIAEDIVYVHTRSDVLSAKKRIYLAEMIKQTVQIEKQIESTLKRANIKLLPKKFKYLKSKFGSYHRKHDDITLNTILAKLDPIYLTYVLFHEYAHTKVFDHSTRFYKLLDQLMPGHKTIQKRLKNVVIM